MDREDDEYRRRRGLETDEIYLQFQRFREELEKNYVRRVENEGYWRAQAEDHAAINRIFETVRVQETDMAGFRGELKGIKMSGAIVLSIMTLLIPFLVVILQKWVGAK